MNDKLNCGGIERPGGGGGGGGGEGREWMCGNEGRERAVTFCLYCAVYL